jgi:hypothetical protein
VHSLALAAACHRAREEVIAMARIPETPSSIDLEELVRDLRDSDIYVGLQTNGLGMKVWISEQVHGRRVDHTFEPAASGDAASHKGVASHWLHTMALRLYPESLYASRHSSAGKS